MPPFRLFFYYYCTSVYSVNTNRLAMQCLSLCFMVDYLIILSSPCSSLFFYQKICFSIQSWIEARPCICTQLETVLGPFFLCLWEGPCNLLKREFGLKSNPPRLVWVPIACCADAAVITFISGVTDHSWAMVPMDQRSRFRLHVNRVSIAKFNHNISVK